MASLTERLQFILEVNNKSAVKGVQEFGKASEKALGDADKKLDQVAGRMTKVGAGAVAFAGVASVALYKVGSAAGEQNAAFAAMEQVLGEASGSIAKWADGSVKAVGLSKTAAVDAARQFGGLAKIAGESGEGLATWSTGMVKAAADMAAFANVSPEQTLQDLQSGFAGSTEVLRKYNIYLDDVSLKQAFFRETGEKVTGTLTAQQRIIATHSEVMRQGADMWGQWDREIDSVESKQAMFKASLNDLAAGIGQGVVPVMSSMLDVLNGTVEGFNGLPDPVKRGAGGLAAFGVAAAGGLGVLSLLVGQAIKMRDNLQPLVARLKNSEGGLTRMGKAAAIAGTAMATLAAVELADSILFSGEGASHADLLTRRLQALTIAIGDMTGGTDDGSAAMQAFMDNVAAEGHHALTLNPFTNLGHIAENFGKSLTIVGSTASRDIEQVDRAFKKLMDQSPEQAQALLDEWLAQADALDHNSGQYRDNADAISKYQGWLDLATGSQKALTAATEGSAAANEDAAAAQEAATEASKRAVELTKERVVSLKEELDALEEVRDALQDDLDARSESADADDAFDRAHNNMLKTFRDLPEAIKNAKGDQLALNDAYWGAVDAINAEAEADVAKWRGAYEKEGLVLSEAEAVDVRNRAWLRGVQISNGPERQAIIERIARLNNIPADVVTDIVANLDDATFADVDQALSDASEEREVAVKVDGKTEEVDGKIDEVESAEYAAEVAVTADTSLAKSAIKTVEDGNYRATVKVYGVPGGMIGPPAPGSYGVPGGKIGPPGHADGTVTTGPEIALIGEDGSEAVIPLTKPDRIRAIMSQPGVASTILGALSGGKVTAMANGGVVTRGAVRGGGAVELRGMDFGEALSTVFAGYAELLGATDDLTAAQHGLNDAFNENGKTLDVNTDKGRANRDAVVSNWDAVKDLAEAQFEQGASVEEVTAAMHGHLDQLRQQLAYFGLTTEEIDAYLASMNATPAAIDAVTAALQEQQRVAAAEEAAEKQVRTEDYLYAHQKLSADRYLAILKGRLAGLEEYTPEWIRLMDQIDGVEQDKLDASEERERKIVDQMKKRAAALSDWADSVEDAFARSDDAAQGAQNVAEGLEKVQRAVWQDGIGAGSGGRQAVLDQLNVIADAAKGRVEAGEQVGAVQADVNKAIVELRREVVAGGGSAAEFDRLRSESGRTSADFGALLRATAVQQAIKIDAPITINGSNMTSAQVAAAVQKGIQTAAEAAARKLRAA